MTKEIERKFLLSHLPTIKADEMWYVEQAYISTEPEVRVRFKRPAKGYFPLLPYHRHLITIKGNGSLVRKEIETPIYENFYDEIIDFIGKKPITKEYFVYYIGNHHFEVSIVDKDSEHSFIYAEVEFQSEEEAKAFKFPFPEILIEEITYQSDYKMKNYWLNNR